MQFLCLENTSIVVTIVKRIAAKKATKELLPSEINKENWNISVNCHTYLSKNSTDVTLGENWYGKESEQELLAPPYWQHV